MSIDRWLDQVRAAGVARGLHPCTRAAYVRWAARYLRFWEARPPHRLAGTELQRFLAVLEKEGCAPATVRQARSALLFLHRVVLGLELEGPPRLASWRPAPALPVDVVRQVLAHLPPEPRLMAELVYGAGLRVGECCRLRIRDLELERGVIRVRRRDGLQDRLTVIPESVRAALASRVAASRRVHLRRSLRDRGMCPLPMAELDGASMSSDWRWMWLFPSPRTRRHVRSGRPVVRPVHPTTLQRALTAAAQAAGVGGWAGRFTCQRLRHTFAAQLLAAGYPIGTVQALLGHRDRATTLRYHDALPVGWLGVRSPLDFGVPVALPRGLTGELTGGDGRFA
ncbi:MAG: tyrosine-type recombinase/integrase [Gemmatimonadetes bacterium]|nr:tyrosine-type recombinase/integrase [Gemmatimonadota bacterium]